MFFKKIVNFLFYYLYPRFYKKIEIFEIQNFNKIPSFTIHFNFSSIFGILLCISPIQTCPKIMNFFVVFYWKGWDFTNNFCKILKVLLKKILICEIFFFFQNSAVYYLFFTFLLFLTFYFQFRLFVLVKKFWKFLCFFILWITDFIKEFWKTMECFSKK